MENTSRSEQYVQTEILDWLNSNGIFAFRVNNGAVYDQKAQTFRKKGKWEPKGVSDIHGVLRGRALWIEVKDDDGVVSDEQKTFIAKINKEGGLAFVARSVEGVKDELARAGEKIRT